jgi:hypothetical protein
VWGAQQQQPEQQEQEQRGSGGVVHIFHQTLAGNGQRVQTFCNEARKMAESVPGRVCPRANRAYNNGHTPWLMAWGVVNRLNKPVI